MWHHHCFYRCSFCPGTAARGDGDFRSTATCCFFRCSSIGHLRRPSPESISPHLVAGSATRQKNFSLMGDHRKRQQIRTGLRRRHPRTHRRRSLLGGQGEKSCRDIPCPEKNRRAGGHAISVRHNGESGNPKVSAFRYVLSAAPLHNTFFRGAPARRD